MFYSKEFLSLYTLEAHIMCFNVNQIETDVLHINIIHLTLKEGKVESEQMS